jgi:hypothetical protein
MSDFIVQIIDPQVYTIDIETNFVDNINNIEIQRYDQFNIDVINVEKILPSDLPDFPVNRIIGDFPVSKISGLKEYLDSYHFDCGSP